MKILVTGVAGFIGGHLAGRLTQAGHHVVGVDKRHGQSTADRDRFVQLVAEHRPDVIAHLGANCSTPGSFRDPAGDFDDNAAGTFNVCEAARLGGGIPVLFVSTVKIHAGHDGLVAPLGVSKQVGEDYLRAYGGLYGVPWIIDRPSTVYGPGQDATADAGWVTWLARVTLAGILFQVGGDGTQSRDVLYIDDMVDLLVDQVEHFASYAGGIYDIGGGPDNEVSVNEMLAELNYRDVVYVPRRPADLQRVVCDNAAVTAVNGWAPRVGWRDGLTRTLDHLRQSGRRSP